MAFDESDVIVARYEAGRNRVVVKAAKYGLRVAEFVLFKLFSLLRCVDDRFYRSGEILRMINESQPPHKGWTTEGILRRLGTLLQNGQRISIDILPNFSVEKASSRISETVGHGLMEHQLKPWVIGFGDARRTSQSGPDRLAHVWAHVWAAVMGIDAAGASDSGWARVIIGQLAISLCGNTLTVFKHEQGKLLSAKLQIDNLQINGEIDRIVQALQRLRESCHDICTGYDICTDAEVEELLPAGIDEAVLTRAMEGFNRVQVDEFLRQWSD